MARLISREEFLVENNNLGNEEQFVLEDKNGDGAIRCVVHTRPRQTIGFFSSATAQVVIKCCWLIAACLCSWDEFGGPKLPTGPKKDQPQKEL